MTRPEDPPASKKMELGKCHHAQAFNRIVSNYSLHYLHPLEQKKDATCDVDEVTTAYGDNGIPRLVNQLRRGISLGRAKTFEALVTLRDSLSDQETKSWAVHCNVIEVVSRWLSFNTYRPYQTPFLRKSFSPRTTFTLETDETPPTNDLPVWLTDASQTTPRHAVAVCPPSAANLSPLQNEPRADIVGGEKSIGDCTVAEHDSPHIQTGRGCCSGVCPFESTVDDFQIQAAAADVLGSFASIPRGREEVKKSGALQQLAEILLISQSEGVKLAASGALYKMTSHQSGVELLHEAGVTPQLCCFILANTHETPKQQDCAVYIDNVLATLQSLLSVSAAVEVILGFSLANQMCSFLGHLVDGLDQLDPKRCYQRPLLLRTARLLCRLCEHQEARQSATQARVVDFAIQGLTEADEELQAALCQLLSLVAVSYEGKRAISECSNFLRVPHMLLTEWRDKQRCQQLLCCFLRLCGDLPELKRKVVVCFLEEPDILSTLYGVSAILEVSEEFQISLKTLQILNDDEDGQCAAQLGKGQLRVEGPQRMAVQSLLAGSDEFAPPSNTHSNTADSPDTSGASNWQARGLLQQRHPTPATSANGSGDASKDQQPGTGAKSEKSVTKRSTADRVLESLRTTLVLLKCLLRLLTREAPRNNDEHRAIPVEEGATSAARWAWRHCPALYESLLISRNRFQGSPLGSTAAECITLLLDDPELRQDITGDPGCVCDADGYGHF